MILGTLLCGAAWGVVLVNVDPFLDHGIGRMFFYLSLFLVLVGLVSTTVFGVSYALQRKDVPMYRRVQKSFAVGLCVALLIVALLFLQGKQLLNVWNLMIFIAIICFLFLFRLSLVLHRNKHQEHDLSL